MVAEDPEALYRREERIGGGSSGEVYKGTDRRTGEAVAIKVLELDEDAEELEQMQREIHTLSQLHSPQITRLRGSYLRGTQLWIVMEYCAGGSCTDLVRVAAAVWASTINTLDPHWQAERRAHGCHPTRGAHGSRLSSP